jgi:hypothetical protein
MNPSDNTFCFDKPKERTGPLLWHVTKSPAARDKKAFL